MHRILRRGTICSQPSKHAFLWSLLLFFLPTLAGCLGRMPITPSLPPTPTPLVSQELLLTIQGVEYIDWETDFTNSFGTNCSIHIYGKGRQTFRFRTQSYLHVEADNTFRDGGNQAKLYYESDRLVPTKFSFEMATMFSTDAPLHYDSMGNCPTAYGRGDHSSRDYCSGDSFNQPFLLDYQDQKLTLEADIAHWDNNYVNCDNLGLQQGILGPPDVFGRLPSSILLHPLLKPYEVSAFGTDQSSMIGPSPAYPGQHRIIIMWTASFCTYEIYKMC